MLNLPNIYCSKLQMQWDWIAPIIEHYGWIMLPWNSMRPYCIALQKLESQLWINILFLNSS